MMGHMEWTFTGEVIEWRGPAPYLFVAMTPEDSEDLREAASGLIYWGQVPVHVTIGGTQFTTALFPRDGRYLVPVKAAVQRAEAIGEGATVEVALRLNSARRKLRRTVVMRSKETGHSVTQYEPTIRVRQVSGRHRWVRSYQVPRSSYSRAILG
jgi:hypothetical protein